MQKLFTLTEEQWTTGLSPSGHINNAGVFTRARGVWPYVSSTFRPTNTSEPGLLQASAPESDISSTVVVDDIWSGIITYRTIYPYLYMQGDGGHFYEHPQLTPDGPPTDLRSATPITDPASGIGVYQAVGGTRYLYYAQKTKIGRWDLDGGTTYPTYWTDNYIGSGGTISTTSINSTTIHPMHNFGGSLWMGNGNSVAKITDNGAGGVSFDGNALDLPKDFVITSLSDDGRNLVIAATKDTSVGSTLWVFETSIFFWDIISDSWNREWVMTDSNISSVKNVSGTLYALGSFALYALDFSTPPTPIINLGSWDTPPAGGVSPSHYTSTVLDGVLYWGGQQTILAFGAPVPGKPKALFQPYFFSTNADVRFLIVGSRIRMFLGTADSKYYVFSLTEAAGTGVSAKTIYIPMSEKVQVKRIDIVFGAALASGDELRLDIQRDDAAAATTWGTASYATYGAVRKVSLYNSANDVDYLSLIFNFIGGAVKIKSVSVFGEPMET